MPSKRSMAFALTVQEGVSAVPKRSWSSQPLRKTCVEWWHKRACLIITSTSIPSTHFCRYKSSSRPEARGGEVRARGGGFAWSCDSRPPFHLPRLIQTAASYQQNTNCQRYSQVTAIAVGGGGRVIHAAHRKPWGCRCYRLRHLRAATRLMASKTWMPISRQWDLCPGLRHRRHGRIRRL